jgi:hypothetical protein
VYELSIVLIEAIGLIVCHKVESDKTKICVPIGKFCPKAVARFGILNCPVGVTAVGEAVPEGVTEVCENPT